MMADISILNSLDNTIDSTSRLQAVDLLREHVRSNLGRLNIPDLTGLFSRLRSRLLNDTSNSVVFAVTQFLIDLSPEYGRSPDIDSEMSTLIPAIITNLGHQKSPIRKASLMVLQKFIRQSHNQSVVIADMIKYGLHCDEWKVRKETIDALSTILDSETIQLVDRQHLISALVGRLRDVSDTVVRSAANCLGHLRTLPNGEEMIAEAVASLPQILSQLYERYNPRIQQAIEDFQSGNFNERPSITVGGSEGSLGVDDKMNSNSLVFGLIPEPVIKQLKDKQDWKTRAIAIETLQRLIGDMETIPPAVMKYNLVEFMEFLVELLEDPNFKITLVTLHIIDDLLLKCSSKTALRNIIPALVPALITRLADTKTVMRQASMNIMQNLMKSVGPKSVLDQSIPLMQTSESQRVKQEVLNVIISSLLLFSTYKFDIDHLVREILPRLKDEKTRVRYVALEACAVLANQSSAEEVTQIMMKHGADEEILGNLQSRLENPHLPHLSPEGLVEHIATRASSGRMYRTNIKETNYPKDSILRGALSAGANRQTVAIGENRLINALKLNGNIKNTYNTAPKEESISSLLPKLDSKPSIVNHGKQGVSEMNETQLMTRRMNRMSTNENLSTKMERPEQNSAQDRSSFETAKSAPPMRSMNDTAQADPTLATIIRRTTTSSVESSNTIRKATLSTVKPVVAAMTEIKLTGSAEADFRKAMGQLKAAQEWESKVQAIDTISALMQNGIASDDKLIRSIFVTNLREICVTLVGETQNIRTQVCRSAFRAINRLYQLVGKAICTGGPDLDSTIAALMRKLGEGVSGRDNFMSEEVEQALDTVCRIQGAIAPLRVMNALLSGGADHKNALVRAKVASCLLLIISQPESGEIIVSKLNSNPKECERPILTLARYLGEGLQETRSLAKRTLQDLDMKTGDLLTIVDKIIPNKEATAVKDMLLASRSQTGRQSVTQSLNGTGTLLGGRIKGSKESLVKSSTESLQNVENFNELISQLEEADWKRKYDAISSITNLITTFPESFNSSSTKIVKLFDVFIERLRDNNSKVNLYALQSLNEMAKPLKDAMEHVIINLIPAIACNLGASSAPARQAASDVLDTLNREISDKALALQIQAMTGILQFGGSATNNAINSPKVKAIIIEKFTSSLKRVASSQNMGAFSSNTNLSASNSVVASRFFSRSAIPVLNKLSLSADATKCQELRSSLANLAKFTRSVMESQAFESAFANKAVIDKIYSFML